MRREMIVVGLLAMMPAVALAQSRIESSELTGAGAWKTDGKSPRPAQRWSLDLQRASDGSVRGRVTLADSPLASAGNLSGHIIGTNFTGTISDDQGNLVAKLSGRVSKQGIDGIYTDRTLLR